MAITFRAAGILAYLSFLSFLCYFVRYIPSATKDLIKADLHLNDFQTGFLFTSFIIFYMVASPLAGIFSDTGVIKRKYLLVAGVLMWSVGTSALGLVTNYWVMLLPRMLFGAGEAIFCALAAPLLCDYFEPRHRNIVMSIFMSSIPIGAAAGYSIAGTMGQLIGWRKTSLILGLPGLLALPLLLINEPAPGSLDPPSTAASKKPPTQWQAIKAMATNANFAFACMGYITVTFAQGGLSDWLPAYLERYFDVDPSMGGTISGGIVVIGGLGGTIVGAVLGTVGLKWTGNSTFAVSSISLFLSTICALGAFYWPGAGRLGVEVLMLGAVFFGYMYNGPINNMVNIALPADLRGRGNGLTILLIHLLGDSISPSIIGAVSDMSKNDLRGALMVVPCAEALSALIWVMAWIFVTPLPASVAGTDKAKKSPQYERLRCDEPLDSEQEVLLSTS